MLLVGAVASACEREAYVGRSITAAAADTLRVSGGFSYATPGSEETALYFTVHNPTGKPDTLVRVITPDSAAVTYHRSVTDGGLVRMEPLGLLSVPADDSLVLAPGGIHLMLLSAKRRSPGDTIHLSLAFARAGTRALAIPVLAPGEPPAAHDHE
ncbi:MAG TPA: copper chaperone PCu(A)C [Gemmatimonadales bacterium]